MNVNPTLQKEIKVMIKIVIIIILIDKKYNVVLVKTYSTLTLQAKHVWLLILQLKVVNTIVLLTHVETVCLILS